jgi:hypothetical protein
VSNTRHLHVNGAAPVPGDAAQNPVNALGQSIACHLAAVLGELVKRATAQPDCLPCIIEAKKQIRAYEVRCANALAAGEDAPALPEPPQVARSVTVQHGDPVCFGHVETDSVQPQQP